MGKLKCTGTQGSSRQDRTTGGILIIEHVGSDRNPWLRSFDLFLASFGCQDNVASTLTMLSEEFSATDEELQLSSRLLETNNWHNADRLSVDAAISIFKQSGLTFKQLRDIWTIADKEGSGSLSKHELAVAIRLMGWVQAGQPLHEDLLASGVLSSDYVVYFLGFQKLSICLAGPMPFIEGITDSIQSGALSIPDINVQIPLINAVDVERFQVAFNGANPVLGTLDSALFIHDGAPRLIDHTYCRGKRHDDALEKRLGSVL